MTQTAQVYAFQPRQSECEETTKASHSAATGISFQSKLSDNRANNSNSPKVGEQKTTSSGMQSTHQNSQPSTPNPEVSVDQKLVARVQKGDKKAFDLLVVKYQGKVSSIVSRYVNDYHEIADVTQEAFIKAYKALKGFRGDSAFYTWLYRIAINCAKNHLVAKGRRPPSSDIDIDDVEHLTAGRSFKDIATPESLLNRNQLEQRVKQALSQLPEDLRVALTLREFEGLSYDEIAGVMDCPVGTVRSRIFRAREFVDQAVHEIM